MAGRLAKGGLGVVAKRPDGTETTVVERFLRALVAVDKAVSLYPPASSIPQEAADAAAAVLAEALQEVSEVSLVVTKQGLYSDGDPLFPDQSAYEGFSLSLYNRHLAEVRFHTGAKASDIISFLLVLALQPEEIAAGGGFEARLWELGVSTVTVTDAHVAIVDAGISADEATAMEAPRLSRNEIDELLAAAYGGRPRDQLTVARFLGDHVGVADYLTQTYIGSGTTPDLLTAAERFAELAEIAYEVGGESGRAQLMKALGDAFTELPSGLKRQLLMDEVLPEARTNEALASVIRQMDIDEVCRMLVEDLDEDQASREGMARAIRNLSMISMADRDEVKSAAGAAMRGAGFSEGMVGEVLESAAPSRLTVRDGASTSSQAEKPADAIFKLMDLAPTPKREIAEEDDPALRAIQEEARRGITDGEVIMALVSLVGMDARLEQFAGTMSMLEDSLDVLIERGEFDVAADAADALSEAAKNEQLDSAQRERVRKAVTRFMKPEDIKSVAHALRLYKPGSLEYESARRLLDVMGSGAVSPMLEQLADETDMAARKALIDLLSRMAIQFIAEFGAYVSDSRWFVVRNVVTILGATKSSAALPYLERTVRHPEPRVRREVLRALSGLNDRMAHQMLISMLDDDDAQNVQLAARYLGAAQVESAIPPLEQVARGEGRGNRDSGPRVEAIEALGRIRSRAALPTLEALAGKRSILGAAKAREIRAAAESAIARINAPMGGAR